MTALAEPETTPLLHPESLVGVPPACREDSACPYCSGPETD